MSHTVRYLLNGVSFEWDAEKAARNRFRHGVPFELACEVFFDPFACWLDATRSDEDRDAAIGRTESQALLHVVHVSSHEEVIRIVSARHATCEERRIYEQF
jgi:uncharacterized DUF497 family protein